MCDAKFRFQDLLNLHITINHKNAKKNINVAKIVSVNSNSSSKHCYKCNEWFPTSRIMKIHFDIIHNHQLPYKCDLCNAKASSIKIALDHAKKHDKKNYYWCKKCDYQYLRQDELVNHIYKSHNTLKWIECDMCDSNYKTLVSLNAHKKISHANITKIIYDNSETNEIPSEFEQVNSTSLCNGTPNKTNIVQVMDGSIGYETNKMLSNILQNSNALMCNGMQNKVEIIQEMNHTSVCKINQMLSEIQSNDGLDLHNTTINEVVIAQTVDGSSNCETDDILPEIQQNSLLDIQNSKANEAEMTQVINSSIKCKGTININENRYDEYSRDSLQNKINLKQNQTYLSSIKVKNNPVVSRSPITEQTNGDLSCSFILIDETVIDGMIPYLCNICGMKQTSYLSGLKHANRHCQYKKYPCTQCNKTFYNIFRLVKHEKKIHPSFNIKHFQCGHCNK